MDTPTFRGQEIMRFRLNLKNMKLWHPKAQIWASCALVLGPRTHTPKELMTWNVMMLQHGAPTMKKQKKKRKIHINVWGDFWAWPVKILVCLSPTGCMLWSSGFSSLIEVHSKDSPKLIGNFLKSWTSMGYFSNSTGSSATSGRFSPCVDSHQWTSSFHFQLQLSIMLPSILTWKI